VSSPPTRNNDTFTVPAGLADGPHVLSIMVRNNSHNEDGGVNDAHKEGRGVIGATFDGVVPSGVTWRIQGAAGVDPVRGPLNNGGLYGERNGWSLPGFDDHSWSSAPVEAAPAGTAWYRTSFGLKIPKDIDASLGLTIGDPAVPRSDRHYRVLIFVNGWNMGQYIADVGPQHTFALPTGVLNPRGRNTVALAVTGDGASALESVRLTTLGVARR
jgi:beta-galactosidase GanA